MKIDSLRNRNQTFYSLNRARSGSLSPEQDQTIQDYLDKFDGKIKSGINRASLQLEMLS